ncbi:MAG: biotin/lipoyl-binding protein, partial [Pseudolabrys sp.]
MMPTSRIFAASFVFVLPALVVSHAQQPTIPTVNVITAEKRPVTESVRFVGRIQAIERVDIRARVTGYLENVLFKDGEQVKTGTPLYRIERGPFEA